MNIFKLASFLLAFFIVGLSTNQQALAQEIEEEQVTGYQSLLKRINNLSGMAGPDFNFGPLNGEGININGFSGAALVNQEFFIGIFGMEAANAVQIIDTADINNAWSLNYKGLWLGYIFNHEKLVHPTASAKIGWGGMEYGLAEESVLVIAPELALEVNLTSWAKAHIGVGYRYINGFDRVEYNDIDLDHSAFLGLGVKFGWFK